MRVLVTGSAGTLGRCVVEKLLASGEVYIRCLIRPHGDTGIFRSLSRRYPDAHLEIVTGNLTSAKDAARAVEDVDCVYHLAGAMRGLPATIFLNTVVASQRLVEALRGTRTRVVLVSSIGVYETSHLPPGSMIDESIGLDSQPEKRSPYFHAKIWQERIFRREAQESHRELVVVRPGILYGYGRPQVPGRIGILIGNLIFQFGDSTAPLPLSHVQNCADAIALAGRHPEASGRIFNVVDDELPTIHRYLAHYRSQAKHTRTMHLSFLMTMLLARLVQAYRRRSHGQIPALHESRALWGGYRFDNHQINKLGWTQAISTERGLREEFQTSLPQPQVVVPDQAPLAQTLPYQNPGTVT
jgi:nucleoside-diphosphate-sugar epimerase